MIADPSRKRAGNWLSRLARQLGITPIPADVTEHLAELHASVAALSHVQTENQAILGGLREAVEHLEKQLARAGKEQFKANTLAEDQQRSVTTMLAQLREAEVYRERELAQLRERLANARSEGRLDIIKGLLPTLDGLGEALASGERLLTHAAYVPVPASPVLPLTVAQRLNAAAKMLFKPGSLHLPSSPVQTLPLPAMAAWLEGLTFVQDRLLAMLAAEGVYPIETEGEPFDPHQHVAVETVPATGVVEPDTIVRETRRGYIMGETVLRYAEVVVARAPQESAAS